MKVVCIGDSLTYGNVGYSYFYFLYNYMGYDYINKGKNGDSLRGMFSRLKKIVNNPNTDSDLYIIGIGTNDILLPYLRDSSPFWFLLMSSRCKIKRCIEDDETFYQEYNELLNFLHERNKKVIIFGMPFINLEKFPDEKLVKRNKMIEDLSKKYNYPFIDIYKLQKEKIQPDNRVYTWKYRFLLRSNKVPGKPPDAKHRRRVGFLLRIFDYIIMTLVPISKNYFAKIRGLTTTVDGVHFSYESARILAIEIAKNIYYI
ncbi:MULTISPECIES: SGNH/GDSL hydrolase family protein [unclassified Parvimonas]|uniref:SGNH/GDSL hydrolase family protein n=1 Tax=unclassified Parvimonas TaxID=1151464 RepID=UPI002B4A6FA6|nr:MULTISPECIES: SGNH/GDSL hydrolase family protein [unclassified Parvimonas]MEB3024912.1 SGNH/GDSL hydrolase family protein [Parvimonas sp. M13]MEB3088943.1 SGNH/GDSL hydrolase family protein [Parvimonas sp. M20]